MTDKTIDGLPTAGAIAGTEKIPMTQNGNTVHITVSQLAQEIANIMPSIAKAIRFRGARAVMMPIVNLTGNRRRFVATWDLAEYDSDQFWSAGAPNRLVVPEGVNLVQLSTNMESIPNLVSVNIIKNGTDVVNAFGSEQSSLMFTGPVSVEQGDYFEVEVVRSSSADVSYTPNPRSTFLSLEVKDAEI